MPPERVAVIGVTVLIAGLLALTVLRSEGRGARTPGPSVGPAISEPVRILPGDPEREPPAPGGAHVIEPGDTLEALALRYYGTPRAVAALLEANPGLVPESLRVGTRVRLPERASRSPSPQPAARPGWHVVRPGESLTTIALRHYGTASAWRRLFEANRSQLRDPDHLVAGVRLRLP